MCGGNAIRRWRCGSWAVPFADLAAAQAAIDAWVREYNATRQIVTVHVADATITIDLGGDDTRTVRRTTTQPVRSIKAQQPRKAAHVSQANRKACPGTDPSTITWD